MQAPRKIQQFRENAANLENMQQGFRKCRSSAGFHENAAYFQVFTDSESNFLSGTFTTEKTFQYYNTLNVTTNINLEIPPVLILNDEYKFTLMGLNEDNWVNLMIQKSFIAQ